MKLWAFTVIKMAKGQNAEIVGGGHSEREAAVNAIACAKEAPGVQYAVYERKGTYVGTVVVEDDLPKPGITE